MWKYNGRVIRQGRGWIDDNRFKHPYNWNTAWSEAEKIAKGLVWEDDPLPYDSRFYWAHDVPKALEDVAAVDENGDPILDEEGNQVITKGVKSVEIAKVKQQAGGELQATDWYVIRASEGGDAVPAEVLSERQAIRDASNAKEAAIIACTTLEELIELLTPTVEV
jgi:hypothetical protein